MPKKISLFTRFHNNVLINQQHTQTERFWDFNVKQISHDNLRRLRILLLQGGASVHDKTVHPLATPTTENHDEPAKFLTQAEQHIFNHLVSSFTLKHGTDFIEAINAGGGKMKALRQREAEGDITNNRHSSSAMGHDSSLFFVMGIGNHKIPSFVSSSKDVVTIDLGKMAQEDPLTLARFWISGHLSEYQAETIYQAKLGNAKYSISHKKNHQKTYNVRFDNGECRQWSMHYRDEVFLGNDAAPGVAMQFIYLLRLLGGDKNPLINKLYNAATPTNRQSLLEKIMPFLMPGWVYPEAKIIGELDITKDYVSVERNHSQKKQVMTERERANYKALESSIEGCNLVQLKALLKKGYAVSSDDSRFNLLSTTIEKVKESELRREIMQLLIQYGSHALGNNTDDESPIYTAAEKGTATDLDFLLSQEYPMQDEPLIRRIPNAHRKFGIFTRYMDLADLVVFQDFSGEKLKVLKKHGVNFHEHAISYVNRALKASGDSIGCYSVNFEALRFLQQEGITLDQDNGYNETPLMAASRSGNLMLVRFFVELMQANVNAPLHFAQSSMLCGKTFYDDPSNGKTALHFAAEKGCGPIVEYLLGKGANASLITIEGLTAADSVPAQFPELKERLRKASAMMRVGSDILTTAPAKKRKSDHSSQMRHQKVAALLVGVRADGKRYIVLGRPRASENAPKDYLCFPGGSADPEDKSLQDAALRELFEETSIDVKKMSGITISNMGEFNGFLNHDHDTTSFFLIDIGSTLIKPFACDDLVEVRSVLIDELHIDRDKPTVNYMTHRGDRILGSNALMMDSLFTQGCPALTSEQFNTVTDMLHIEANGNSLLVNTIKNNSGTVLSNRSRMEFLLTNQAHQQKGDSREDPLLTMLQFGDQDGLRLLIQYGVNVNGAGPCNINGKSHHLTPLEYCVLQNNLITLQFLVANGADVGLNRFSNRLLQLAAENGYSEMFSELLSYGLNPNPDFDTEKTRVITQPILGMAVKHNQLAFLERELKNGHVMLNRERSPVNANSTLITAIDYDNKEAAFMLLASLRLNLDLANKSKQSALTVLQSKENWSDVKLVIEFLKRYGDMEQYLAENHQLHVDAFRHVLDDNGFPTIQLISNSRKDLERLSSLLGGGCTIHQEADKYYIQLGKVRLNKLGIHPDVVHFLLAYCKESPFFMRISNLAYIRRFVNGTLSRLNANDTPLADNLLSKRYITQVVQESDSIGELDIRALFERDNFKRFLEITKSHKNVSSIVLDDEILSSLSSIEEKSRFIDWITSFPQLNKIIYHGAGYGALYGLIRLLVGVEFQQFMMTIDVEDALYNQSEQQNLIELIRNTQFQHEIIFKTFPAAEHQQINLALSANQWAAISKKTPSFQEDLKNIAEHGGFFRGPGHYADSDKRSITQKIVETKLYYQWIAKQNPDHLTIFGPFNQHSLNDLRDILTHNVALKSVSLTNDNHSSVTEFVLGVLRDSSAPIDHINLSFLELNERHIQLLNEVLTKLRIRMLNFDYTKFTLEEDKQQVLVILAETIASHPYLETVIASSVKCKVGLQDYNDRFIDVISNSRHILSLVVSAQGLWGRVSANSAQKAKLMCANNCQNELSSVTMPVVTGGLFFDLATAQGAVENTRVLTPKTSPLYGR